MRIVYVLLSPTFGMHQYTADLANRVAALGHDAVLVTTTTYARDRYAPSVQVAAPVTTHGTGFKPEGLRLDQYRRVVHTLQLLAPDVVHITGVHLWNVPLVRWLRRRGVPVIHTLHDLDPHHGVPFGRLIRIWNRLIIGSASHLLVHGQIYAERLLASGCEADRVSCVPLLHLFLSYEGFARLADNGVNYGGWALFFGRLESYKGVAHLIAAERKLGASQSRVTLVLAGSGPLGSQADIAPSIDLRNHRIDDDEAIDLFQSCGLLILPYLDASQSALVAAAYYFAKPVIVTDVGALPEYVQPGVTGWVVPAGDAGALADAWRDAMSNQDRLRRMGETGRTWYFDQRLQEQAVLVAMYEKVVKERQAP
ncbi:MAG: glycosyltransferase [Caldilineales bacterium]